MARWATSVLALRTGGLGGSALGLQTADFLEVHRDDLGDAGLFHRDAVEGVGNLHRPLVVGDEDELAAVGHAADQFVEATDVGFIERRVHFVEQTERRRLDEEDRKDQRHRRHRLFPA